MYDNVPMEEVTLNITYLGSQFKLHKRLASTWGEVADELAVQVGVSAYGLRLLYKGRTTERNESLAASHVRDGARLMAMKTSKQHEKEGKSSLQAEAAKAREQVARARNGVDGYARENASTGPSMPHREFFGDDVDESSDVCYVLVTQGLKIYKIIVSDPFYTVLDLKSRLEGMTNVPAKDQKLLFRGSSNINDDRKLIGDLGAKRGSKFMLLFTRERHDAVDSHNDLSSLKTETESLLERVRVAEREVRGRLVSEYADMTILIGELDGECSRLTGNVSAVRVGKNEADDFATAALLLDKLRDVAQRVVSLRAAALSMLQR
jgi:hypothetical protein